MCALTRDGSNITCLLLISTVILSGCITTRPTTEEYRRAFGEAIQRQELHFPAPPGTKIDSIAVNDTSQTLIVSLSPEFSYMPFRQENVGQVYAGMRAFFGDRYKAYHYSIRSLRTPIEQLVPNFFRPDPAGYDKGRIPIHTAPRVDPVVSNTSRLSTPIRGLLNRNISLWHSHGWYYNATEARWEWQRPRLFQSVEDLGPMSFTLPYLIPMLENAGAHVFVPRERDIQPHEAIVDNDSLSSSYVERHKDSSHAWMSIAPGFRIARTISGNVNPFQTGTARRVASDSHATAEVQWIPTIPETGDYAVYISFVMADSNVTDADYTVSHAGGSTTFRVNQQIGGGTWQYLGVFHFRAGVHPDSGKVVLTNRSGQTDRYVTADAVRFGGGMGVIERGGAPSGRPKFTEGARYYLQYAGMPDTLVYSLNNNTNDYKDDYQSRPEYGNYLYGAPFGPNKNRLVPGLGVPMDLSLAFHTDAGITTNDTTVGTLSIYSIEAFDSSLTFPDGVSRLANRDIADLMQTQIVNDLRVLHDPAWRRRELKNADYSESVRPNFPGVLLELLSHQNFLDMKFMQDPQFRFDASRAIYKSMLRFLSIPENPNYVVQPLPVSHFAAELTPIGDVLLRWQPVADPLEPTALPDNYIVYTRLGDGGFDNGRLVNATACTLRDIPIGVPVSLKVTGVNAGGESFPSEVLSVYRAHLGAPNAVVVNGFHRVAAPAIVEAEGYSGFANMQDAGVPDHIDYNFTGQQYDMDPKSPFRSNDSPGHGASMADDETHIVAGNTLDYTSLHGASLYAAGFAVSSCSAEAVQDSMINLQSYALMDVLLGEQKSTPRVRPGLDSLRGIRYAAFPQRFRDAIQRYVDVRGRLFVSGSYVGTDLYSTFPRDSSGMRFARDVLKYTWVTGHASRTGGVVPAAARFMDPKVPVNFSVDLNPRIYPVESPDALAPVKGGSMLLRYSENLFGAAVGYRGMANVVVMGFPFETITTKASRDAVMKGVVNFLRGE
jgi:hypothetical protein